MTRKRYPAAQRREMILETAARLATHSHYMLLTRDEIGAALGISGVAVQQPFGKIGALRDAIVRHAIERRILPVIVQAIAAKHPAVLALDTELRTAAIDGLRGENE